MTFRNCMLVATLFSLASAAKAGVILSRSSSFNVTQSVGSDPGPFEDRVAFRYGGYAKGTSLPSPPTVTLFDTVDFTLPSLGTTWTADASDPDFASVRDRLTNGINDNLFVSFSTFKGTFGRATTSSGGTESGAFSTLGGTDLAGFTLSAITVRLDSLRFTDNVQPLPDQPGYLVREFSGAYTLTWEGDPVPEPTTLLLSVSATTLVLGRPRRRRRRM